MPAGMATRIRNCNRACHKGGETEATNRVELTDLLSKVPQISCPNLLVKSLSQIRRTSTLFVSRRPKRSNYNNPRVIWSAQPIEITTNEQNSSVGKVGDAQPKGRPRWLAPGGQAG